MEIKRRNMLCIKDKESIDMGHRLLYEPYKNILEQFLKLTTNKDQTIFDPVSKVFDGLSSISDELKYYYEALLGITSYYQHSKGGRGKYIEKKLSSVLDTCSINIKLSEFPIWLKFPKTHRKKGILTKNGLSTDEKSKLRNIEWDFLYENEISTDIGNLIEDEKTVVLTEIKNRVDSGGIAGRREIWTRKFYQILECLCNKNLAVYRLNNEKFNLSSLLNYFGYKNLELYIGILFNIVYCPPEELYRLLS